MKTEENIRLKQELKSLQTSQPHLNFQQAWAKLQPDKPWLFDGSSPIDAASTLKHNADVRTLSDKLMASAKRNQLQLQQLNSSRSRIEATYGPLGTAKLVQSVSERP